MDKLNIRILFLEDNDTDAILLREALTDDPLAVFQLQIAACLSAGLQWAQTQHFNVILLDLGLPDSQGLATFEQIHRAAPELPVVVLSGVADEQLAIEAVQAGAQDYVVKGPQGWGIVARAIRYAIERQKMQAALYASEHRFRALIEHNSDAVILVSATGEILYESPAAERILGYVETEHVGLDAFEFLHPDDRARIIEKFGTVAQTPGATVTAEFRHIHKNGSVRWGEGTATNLLDEPAVQAIVVNHRDITKRKQAEEALQESEQRYRTLFETMAQGVTYQDAGGTLSEPIRRRNVFWG